MAVWDVGWATINANSSLDWFTHGWNNKETMAYSICVFGVPAPGVPYPLAKATITRVQYMRHVDGTFAQLISIQNNAPFNPVDVHLLAQYESL
jgi:hypothetical protein